MDLYFLNRPQKPMCQNWNFCSSQIHFTLQNKFSGERWGKFSVGQTTFVTANGPRIPDLFPLKRLGSKMGQVYAYSIARCHEQYCQYCIEKSENNESH